MNKVKDFSCTLLRLERLKQNKGQKEVCYGICVPSYLSKIENNQVTPDSAILKQLFQRLGIEYHGEEAFVIKYKELIELYYEQLTYFLDKTSYPELLKADQEINYSPLAIDWLIIKGYEEDNAVMQQLSQCRQNMSDRQLAYYNLLQPLNKETITTCIPLYIQAYYILNNSFSLLLLMMAYFIAGQYDKVHEHADKCISLALEEGNTCNLAGCYQLIGTVYACLNVEDMMLPFYKRAIRLLQNTNWKDQLNGIYYNIGATLISTKKYDQALQYLNMVQEEYTLQKSHTDLFLLNHKKALALIRSNRKEEAQGHIEHMNNILKEKTSEDSTVLIEKLMFQETVYECQEHFLEDPGYVELLETLMEHLKKNRHKGYNIFYYDMLKEAYCRQRKYKKALELYEEFPHT